MPNGMLPIRLANSMKMKEREDPGHVFLAFGADADVDHVVDEADQALDRDLPAARERAARFMPPNMNSQIVPSTISVHSALLVKTKRIVAHVNEPKIGSIVNWCIGSILPSAATLRPYYSSARAVARDVS